MQINFNLSVFIHSENKLCILSPEELFLLIKSHVNAQI